MSGNNIEPKLYNFLKIFVNWIVDNAEFLMVRAMALLAPVPSAWALYMAFQPTAGTTLAWALAIVIEFMGLCLGVFIANVSSFNNQYSDQKLWKWTSWLVFTIYLVAVWATIGAAGLTPYMVFPLFTLAGAIVIGSRNHIERVEGEHQHKKEVVGKRDNTIFEVELDERKRSFNQKLEIDKMRAVAKLNKPVRKEGVQKSVQGNEKQTHVNGDAEVEPRREYVLDQVVQGTLNISETARLYRVERSSVHHDLNVLARRDLVHRNGQGWRPGPGEQL